jgi:RNA polymerase sigma factor for flagellar operon FliA
MTTPAPSKIPEESPAPASAALPPLYFTPEEREAAILEPKNIGIVYKVASNTKDSLPKRVELRDIMQAGMLGLIQAAQSFDKNQGVLFITYAKHRIRGAIKDFLRELDDHPRCTRALLNKAQKILDASDNDSTIGDVANALGRTTETRTLLHHMIKQAQSNEDPTISLSTFKNNERHNGAGVALPVDKSFLNPEKALITQQENSSVHAALSKLPPRYRRAVELYYAEGKTTKEVGVALKVNESRASQILKLARTQLEVSLTQAGYGR